MPLDLRGKIAAAEIGFYVPIAIISLVLTIRYGFRRDAGWFFLFFFALSKLSPDLARVETMLSMYLARTAGGALIVAAEMIVPAKVDLYIAAYIMFPAGLALLMLSTIGFLGLA